MLLFFQDENYVARLSSWCLVTFSLHYYAFAIFHAFLHEYVDNHGVFVNSSSGTGKATIVERYTKA